MSSPAVATASVPFSVIRGYTRPKAVPPHISGQYKIGGFSEDVRKWHLDRIPQITIADVTTHPCPWCSKEVDQTSLEIDHIIPVKEFVRYKLWLYVKKHAKSVITQAELEAELVNAYNDPDNLLLSCTESNRANSNNVPTVGDIAGVIRGLDSAVTERLTNASNRARNRDMREMLKFRLISLSRYLRAIDSADEEIGNYVMDGPTVPFQSVTLRPRSNSNPMQIDTSANAEFQRREVVALMSRVINDKLGLTRPAWFVDQFNWLLQRQPQQRTDAFTGRLCFYCLGVSNEMAFHLDHIAPRNAKAEGMTAALYSDAGNLIPVCRTCNTSKSDRPLTGDMLTAFTQQRIDAGRPGIPVEDDVNAFRFSLFGFTAPSPSSSLTASLSSSSSSSSSPSPSYAQTAPSFRNRARLPVSSPPAKMDLTK